MIETNAPRPSSLTRWPFRVALVAALLAASVLLLFRNDDQMAGIILPETPPQWNILLVSFDTTRPDFLQSLGGTKVATPGLARVVGNGVVFEQATSPAPITLPAHATLLTGENPYRHGARENTEHALPESRVTLPEILSRHGYRTGAFVSSFVLDSRFGLAQGFETYIDRLDGPEPGLSPGSPELTGAIVSGRAAQWIRQHADRRARGEETRPFFLFVHFFDAHIPYAPPAPFVKLHPGDPYAGELAYQDACFGQILDAVQAAGEATRTLVWAVSDHGESLGAHGEETHSLFVYDVTQRIVSVLQLPPASGEYVAGEPALRVVTETGLVDVAPTLLDLLHVPESLPEPDGLSLRAMLEERADPERGIYLETLSPLVSYGWAPLHAVRTAEWKLIRAPRPELYDLIADPRELDNLIDARADVAAKLDPVLTAFLENESTGDTASRTASPEELERLRSLGYLGGAGHDPSASDLPDPKDRVQFFHEEFQDAKTALLQGNYDEAIPAFERALVLDPGNHSAQLFLATALREAGELDQAGFAYRRAILLVPGSARAWYGLGRTLLEAGYPDSAALVFRKSLEILPASPEAWAGLGEAYLHGSQLESAATALDSARANGLEPRLANGWLARLYRDNLSDSSRARPYLERYARLSGWSVEDAGTKLPELP